MKPASIIFLIVAAVLALGGLVTMRIAEGIAKKEGVELLNETSADSGEYIFTYEYGEDSVGKISLNVKDAKVNILGTDAKPYIELVNFAEGTYEFASSNRIITISNNSDFSSFENIASMALNFKGLRSIVNYVNVSGREKVVNIYLSESYPVKIIDCKTEKGGILIEDCKSTTDYNVEITSGALNIKNVATTSAINIKLGTGDLFIDDCTVGNLGAEIDTGNIEILTSDVGSLTAVVENGDFSYGYRYSLGMVNLDLAAGVGKVRIDGEDRGGYYEISDLPTYSKYTVTLGKGDIIMNSNMKAERQDTAEQSDTAGLES